jgi:hypothetical protein
VSSAVPKSNVWLSKTMRLVHIYSSMLVLVLLLFFAVTGITLNHPQWQSAIGASSTNQQLQLPAELKSLPWSEDELEQAVQANKIAAWLREQHQVQGAVFNFSYDPDEQLLELDFKRPAGYSTAVIALTAGQVELSSEYAGTLALLNDLHKGRYAGTSWKWLIDFTAVACVLFGLTGFYLLWRQPSRRRSGINTAVFGVIVMLLAYLAALH